MLFEHAIVRKPGPNFAEGLTSYRGAPPDYRKAIDQHDAYCAALERCGLELLRLDPDLAHPDSTFVEDVAVITPTAAVLTRPGAKSREGEVEAIREPVERFFGMIYEITPPGRLDGGDVCESGNHFFIGISRRTNGSGAEQLAEFLARQGFTSTFVDIRAMKSILHLKSGMSCVGEGQLVVIDEIAKWDFGEHEIIRVPPEESYAANCVRVNDYVLIAKEYPRITAELESRGFRLLPLDVSEFRKMDGGLSCLSLRF